MCVCVCVCVYAHVHIKNKLLITAITTNVLYNFKPQAYMHVVFQSEMHLYLTSICTVQAHTLCVLKPKTDKSLLVLKVVTVAFMP